MAQIAGVSANLLRRALRRNVPLVIALLLAMDFAFSLLYLWTFPGRDVSEVGRLLDLDRESNLPTWYSSTKLFVVSGVLGLVARLDDQVLRSCLFAALALVFLCFSADEVIQLHEFLGWRVDVYLPGGGRGNTVFGSTGIWMFVVGIPVTVAILAAVQWARSLFPVCAAASFAKITAGIVLTMLGALGVEILRNFVVDGSGAHAIQVMTEELFEMLGVTVLLWGCLGLLRFFAGRQHLRTERQH